LLHDPAVRDAIRARVEALRPDAPRKFGKMSIDQMLWHVNQALRRLYSSPDTFGKCETCGNEVGFDRLDALPHARLCIACKEKEEDAKRR